MKIKMNPKKVWLISSWLLISVALAGSDLITDVNKSSSSTPGDAAKGKQVYLATCFACHGVDGKGMIPGTPDFTKADGPLVKEDSLLFNNITNGVQNPGSVLAMPPKGGNAALSAEDIWNVISYLKTEFKKYPEPESKKK